MFQIVPPRAKMTALKSFWACFFTWYSLNSCLLWILSYCFVKLKGIPYCPTLRIRRGNLEPMFHIAPLRMKWGNSEQVFLELSLHCARSIITECRNVQCTVSGNFCSVHIYTGLISLINLGRWGNIEQVGKYWTVGQFGIFWNTKWGKKEQVNKRFRRLESFGIIHLCIFITIQGFNSIKIRNSFWWDNFEHSV